MSQASKPSRQAVIAAAVAHTIQELVPGWQQSWIPQNTAAVVASRVEAALESWEKAK